jgi:hypothetical protein
MEEDSDTNDEFDSNIIMCWHILELIIYFNKRNKYFNKTS